MYRFFPRSLAPVALAATIILSSSFKIAQTAYERLKDGNIASCAFYNPDSFSLLKFKNGHLTYTRWNSAPDESGRTKVEEFTTGYSFHRQGMCGTINGMPFVIIEKTSPQSPSTFYLKYNGLNYFLSEHFSD
jgi:hypothetical protein